MRMRDALYLEKDRLRAFIDAIPPDAPVDAVVPLCTCNRIELYYVCTHHDRAVEWLGHYLASFHGIAYPALMQALTNYRCIDAIRHLFRVASGIESMVFGEDQILGQIRAAYFYCLDNRVTDAYLNRAFQQAIATGKKVRTQTCSGHGAVSIPSIAVEHMLHMGYDPAHTRICVAGAGSMGVCLVKRLCALGPAALGVSNRTEARARALCTRFEANCIPYPRLVEHLDTYDVIFLATAAHRSILGADDCAGRRAPLLVIDLGAPRNADPALRDIEQITLICVDDLRPIARVRLQERKKALPAIEKIVETQVHEYMRWYEGKREYACNAA
jgi:glutamyl-tRNA reductase